MATTYNLGQGILDCKEFENIVNKAFEKLRGKYPTSKFFFLEEKDKNYDKDNPNLFQVVASFSAEDLSS